MRRLVEFDPMDHETPGADLDALDELANLVYERVLDKYDLGPIFVEIGSWAGRTAWVLSSRGKTYCVDHWQGSPGDRMEELSKRYTPLFAFQTFCRNMKSRLMSSVIPCVGQSLSWASVWPKDWPIDLVYIDGDHRYEAVKADIKAWFPHVKKNGIIAGHDYHMEGVKRAVDQLFRERVRTAGQSIWYVDLKEQR